ncbi:DEAD/DEAH box helicase [Robertmurraya andreesenii]|uniref:SNF2 family DNA or RNA helicase n=1 Tax=Anoxybacillus andreesenii TaxID=1325932 RepID=A0ABT9V005_9BACL|nr:DEAD/DEAH box helicase [Robertmurraya andreesenii]MDQ0154269.1 SNF2 family DNA or RNA helicase [Robertmurraya andreesenii]
MLSTNALTINIEPIGDNQFFLTAECDDRFVMPSEWKGLLFNRHEESYYGMLIEDKGHGVAVNGWQLATLLAKESFNRLIEWDWDETGQICLAAAEPIYEAIQEKEWVPDFAALSQQEFRWRLPERVKNEFGPSFWEQTIGEDVPVGDFVADWFNASLHTFFEKNKEWREKIGQRLEALQNQSIAPGALAAYFDEETWSEWMGVKENNHPFTIGLRLEEPADIDGTWDLGIFLRGKKEPDLIVDVKDQSNMPKEWFDYLDGVSRQEERWIGLFPWLKGKKGIASALTEEEAWLFLTDASETLLALGVEILLPSWWQAMKDANLKVKAKLKGTSSHRPSFVGLQAMLDYNWRFSMNGVELSEDEFNQLVEEKRRLVYIRGRWIKLDPGFVRQIQDLMKRAEKEGLHVRDLIEQELMNANTDEALTEDERAFARVQIELNRQWKQMVKQLRDVKTIPLEPVPKGFHGELRPYQILGMSWLLFLRQYGFGACLADDMGLGKTIQLLSYLLAVQEKEPDGAALIICPTSVLGNWQKEIERFAPDLKVYLHYGTNRLKEGAFEDAVSESDIVLTSYGLTHLDFSEFERVEWSTIAIDEAQNIKNANTKQSRAVRKLKGKHHIALTGTPMENRLSELWSIFDFTNHGFLGSLGQFHKRYVLPIEKDDNKEKVQELQALIRPFLLRRTKKDEEVALNLPDKQEQKEYCPLTAEQASLYEQLVQDTLAQLETLTGFERKGLILQLLGRLKQLCNHPALYLKEARPKQVLERSLKMEKLTELVEAVLEQDESCLIFTQYIEMGEMIRQVLKDRFGIEAPFLNGSVAKSKRDEMITQFQERKFPVFILSLKAGGTGLNLTAANHVIHYDRWWNPAVENQATDRAYRIGQKRFVHVHKFISTGTLEEKIDLMLEKKQSLNDQIIQSDSWITELSTDELRDLIHLT